MPEINENRDRKAVPRWRTFSDALAFRELGPLKPHKPENLPKELLDEFIKDWKQEPILSVAGDLCCSAFTLGHPEEAKEAATFILADASASAALRRIAEQCLGIAQAGSSVSETTPDFSDDAAVRSRIHHCKRRLIEYPDNPIVWTDLALFYASLGLTKKSDRAIRIALALAPDNRFVARSASRFFLHSNDPERAHEILSRCPQLKQDPWILAGEIAVSSVLRRNSRFIRVGKALSESNEFSPFDISELNAVLGTIEAQDGSPKKARKIFGAALREPAENSMAQAAWMSQTPNGPSLGIQIPLEINSSEARAWKERGSKNWIAAIKEARQWQLEQPFSSRPALMAGYVASTFLEDFELAAAILKRGLQANANDSAIRNNLAFALARSGKTEEAWNAISTIRLQDLDLRWKICVTATCGLIEFRNGNIEQGRTLYEGSQRIAAANPSTLDLFAIATIYHAVEEVRAGTPEAASLLKLASEKIRHLDGEFAEAFSAKLRDAENSLIATH